MSYYPTLAEDLQRAKQILKSGKLTDVDKPPGLSEELWRTMAERSGNISVSDTFATYRLLESFVEEIERLQAEVAGLKRILQAAGKFIEAPTSMLGRKEEV